ncbi:NUDIX domain-containing protein [Gracilibacillus oryzae]|uniref:NUDIX domain-containing protein n=1 Tax=Gracilibacillus oryzae TaxID=1672701 RepID=A0A7C8GU48_9BACI|nr:NUDIX domain-containing protein [Gracilibacillus oryzae]KAB8138008.1 NUDIX domain-containing protein [Gracilibacillus oryzae]
MNLRDRGSAVLIENNKVALIKRIKKGAAYYVFPGGGIEKGETPEEATKREAYEELGIDMEVKECIAEIEYNGKQFFYLGDIVGGNFGTGQGEELSDERKGTYIPVWVEIHELLSIEVKPKEVAEKIYFLFK